MYSGRMVFTVTAWCFDFSYMFPVLCFTGSRLTAVSCMRAGIINSVFKNH
jgi:hypothetical protein